MRTLFIFLFSAGSLFCSAQKRIRDRHITNQQERMVFKQWDRSKFTPTSGFLGLNPEYWLTWALHPNYPKTDLRPLGPLGPQMQRLGLVAAMQSTEEAYKLQSDTVYNTTYAEGTLHSYYFVDVDPLWLLYYKKEFQPLADAQEEDPLLGLSIEEKDYMTMSGMLDWYNTEKKALCERVNIARATNVDRGSRILAYHRMLLEFRKLSALWEDKKKKVRLYLSMRSKSQQVKDRAEPITKSPGHKSDISIADEILKKSKL